MAPPFEQLTGLTVFARVAAAQSFSTAARALGLSTSAVSKHVARLERALGVRLLQRTSRRVSLTEAGATLYERCQRIIAELEAVESDMSRLRGGPSGLLRVSAPMSFGQRHVAALLPAFLTGQPAVRIELELSDRFVDLVAERFDCAVRIGELPDSSLVARRLAPARRLVCGTPAYFAAHDTPRTPDDLRRHNCLGYTYLASPHGWPFFDRGRVRTVAVRGNLVTNNGEALREAALAGLGVALLPTFIVADDLRAGRLQAVLAEHETWDAAIYAVYPPARPVPAKVRAFVDFLARRCGPRPFWDEGLPPPPRRPKSQPQP